MKVKIGRDEFCLYCMEWREFDQKGRCKICKHTIHRVNEKNKKYGYNEPTSESPSLEETVFEDGEDDY